MQQRIALCQRGFYLGLFLMLGTGILSAAVGLGGGSSPWLLTLAGAGICLSARLWHHRLRQAARQGRTSIDLDGCPLGSVRGTRFTS